MHRFFLPLLFLPHFANAQTAFPALSGETVEGRTVTLPLANAKAYTIVGMAYGKAAGPLLEEWFEPAYLRFVAKHGLFAGAYDVDVFFVPLFVGVNKAAYEPSMRKFRKSAAPGVVEHVLFATAELEVLQAGLGMKNKDVPYFFVLDAQGNIVHRAEGAFAEAKLEAIEEILLR
jgi:hypothetical protein